MSPSNQVDAAHFRGDGMAAVHHRNRPPTARSHRVVRKLPLWNRYFPSCPSRSLYHRVVKPSSMTPWKYCRFYRRFRWRGRRWGAIAVDITDIATGRVKFDQTVGVAIPVIIRIGVPFRLRSSSMAPSQSLSTSSQRRRSRIRAVPCHRNRYRHDLCHR